MFRRTKTVMTLRCEEYTESSRRNDDGSVIWERVQKSEIVSENQDMLGVEQIEMFMSFMVANSFSEKTVEDAVVQKAAEITERDREDDECQ